MIWKKYQALKVKNHIFLVILALEPIFGGLPIIEGAKISIFEYRAVFPNSLSQF